MTRPEEVIGSAIRGALGSAGRRFVTVDDSTAQAVIEAIRAMSPAGQAELIGGRVLYFERGTPECRVVGPWREVSDV